MPKKLLLLTGEREAPFLLDFVMSLGPDADVVPITNKSRFSRVVENGLEGARLISFLSAIIVPPEVLSRLDLTPYNIHPGPPERPGLFPEAFAVSEEATDFGVTLHEMTPEIDAGPIVEVRRFKLPRHATRLEVLDQAERHAVHVFAGLARHCVNNDTDLPHNGESWSGNRTTLQDYRLLLEQHGDLKSPHEEQVLKSFRA